MAVGRERANIYRQARHPESAAMNQRDCSSSQQMPRAGSATSLRTEPIGCYDDDECEWLAKH